MCKLKKIKGIRLPFLLILSLFLLLHLSLRAQEKKDPSGEETLRMDEITRLHNDLNETLEKYLKDDEEKEELVVPLGMGKRQNLGESSVYVFVDQAKIKLSGKSATAIEFYYMQSNVANLHTQTRRVVNENIGSDNLNNIKVIFESNLEEDKEFRVKDLIKNESKHKLLVSYRNRLSKTVRLLKTYLMKRQVDQILSIDKILMIDDR